MKKLAVSLFFIAALAAGGWYGYQAVWGAPPPPSYQTAAIARTSIVSTVSATGTVEPTVKVLVGLQVSGTVVRWFADFNQRIQKNFVLANLDPDRYERSVVHREA